MLKSRGYRLSETCKSQGFIKEKPSKIIVGRMFGSRCILYLLVGNDADNEQGDRR